MRTIRSAAVLAALGMAATAAGGEEDPVTIAIIPQPVKVERLGGSFELKPAAGLYWAGADAGVERVARQLGAVLAQATGAAWDAKLLKDEKPPQGAILLETGATPDDMGEEGYELVIESGGVRAVASTPHGLFYAVQTLRQLLPAPAGSGVIKLPAVRIADLPRYRWRGMHLDVGRHFMPVSFVKRYLDLMAYHKFNVFHWHLTEDQGWRIEIKKYPKLTEVGAWRSQDGQRYGGFYSQEEVKQVVAYAAERFITVVPEIEMPGHSQAAMAAYPEYSCTGGPHQVAEKWGIFKDVCCPGNEETYAFLEGVLAEVIGLFPSEFIHIGGDECPKDRWKVCPKCQARMKAEHLANEEELQSYFVRRIEKILNARGRRLVGWDEILEGGLAPNATVMSWRGNKGGIAAAQQGHDVVMSPTTHCYFDYSITEKAEHAGATYAKSLSLPTVYAFEPTPPELTPEQAKHILGAQGNVWTERMADEKRVEWMVFPRACALAEVVWSPPGGRDYAEFCKRLQVHEKRLAAMDVKCPALADLQ